jgi:hydroxyacylglutathione hydrolase
MSPLTVLMRIVIFIVLLSTLVSPLLAETVLDKHEWIHGAKDCSINSEPEIEVYAHDQTTFILRQNKCVTFEAPFIYVLVGKSKILVLDTGDIESPSGVSLYETVKSLFGGGVIADKALLVVHSHSHGDHRRGDSQFEGKPNVTMVKPNGDDVKRYFGLKEWPKGQAKVELGGRTLTVIPTPGHQEEAITIYDPQTNWLFTGDALYPGYIYVKNWEVYKRSIMRLVQFSEANQVAAILGSHIEMTTEPGKYYPIGTTFQPHEAALDLAPSSLRELSRALQESDEIKEIVFDQFIVNPMNVFQRTLSNIARWVTQL